MYDSRILNAMKSWDSKLYTIPTPTQSSKFSADHFVYGNDSCCSSPSIACHSLHSATANFCFSSEDSQPSIRETILDHDSLSCDIVSSPQSSNGSPTYDNSKSNKARPNFSKEQTRFLKAWLENNISNPYPSEEEKNHLCVQASLSPGQLSNFFINARRRFLKKQVKEDGSKSFTIVSKAKKAKTQKAKVSHKKIHTQII